MMKHLLNYLVLLALIFTQNIIWGNNLEDAFSAKKEMLLVEAISLISQKYNVYFTFDHSLVKDISVEYEAKENRSVEEAISGVLIGTDLKFKLYDKRFVILYQNDEEGLESLKEMVKHFEHIIADGPEKKKARRNFTGVTSIPLREAWIPPARKLQNLALNVTGVVTDQQGEALIGVNVQVKGTNKGTATGFDGKYALNNVNENAILVFSYIGYQKQEIPVDGRKTVDVAMLTDAQLLDEVVVVGYGTQKKVNLTGAVGYVSSEVLESRPISSLGDALQGSVANLNITKGAGTLGKATSFNVRGYNSINGGDPLILVNGVPMDVSLINPNDIESVSVLKDAASAAIYGARAAYGVILITTKKGVIGKPKISLSMNYAISKPTIKFEHMSSLDRIDWLDFGSIRSSGNPRYDDLQREKIEEHYYDPSTPEVFENPRYLPRFLDYAANTDWTDVLLKDNYPMQKYDVTLSGSTERFNYYTSLSFLEQKGIEKHFDEKYNRYNFLANLNYDVTEWFNVGTKIVINNSDKIYPPNNSQNNFPEDGLYVHNTQGAEFPVYFPNGEYAKRGSVTNAVEMQEEGGYRTREQNETWLTGTARLTPIKNMSFNIDYSTNVKNQKEVSFWRKLPVYDANFNVSGYYPYTNPNKVTREFYTRKYFIFNAYTEYGVMIKKHNINAIVGYNQENLINEYAMVARENLVNNDIPFLNLATGLRDAADSKSEYAIRSGFSRFTYNFDDRYLFEFNGRYDGSSKFPKSDRFQLFPSFSMAWRLSNEAFFTDLKNSINELKFRISYGSLGNQNVPGYYPYISTFNISETDFVIGDELPLGVNSPNLVSASLTWETVTQKNIGIDFALLNNRLNATFDIYRRDTKNMLTNGETLPVVLGTGVPNSNAANLKTTGFDLTIDWKHKIRNFSYGATLLFSDYTSEITKFSNPEGLINDYYVGQKLGTIWGLETGGFFETDEEAQALDQTEIAGRKRFAGDIYFVDIDGDGKITRGSQTLDDPGDMKIIGNSTPRYSFGIRPYATWRGFDLTIFIQGIGKRDSKLANVYWLDAYTTRYSPFNKIIADDYWTPENTNAYFPAPVFENGTDVAATQTHFLQNSAYIRLKQLTFGYTLPTNLTQKSWINKIRIYFSGNNLWEATKMLPIVDPEMVSVNTYYIPRSFSFGANIDF